MANRVDAFWNTASEWKNWASERADHYGHEAALGVSRLWHQAKGHLVYPGGMSSSKDRILPHVSIEGPVNECPSCLDPLYKTTPDKHLLIINDKLVPVEPIVAHGNCPPVHKRCALEAMKNNHQCMNCRQSSYIEGEHLDPEMFSWISWGQSTGKRIFADVFLAIFIASVLGGVGAGLVAIVDVAQLGLLLEGPIAGAIAGAAFGSAVTSTVTYAISRIANTIWKKVNWRPLPHRIITIALAAASALVALKVAHVIGFYLVSQWVAHCTALNQVSSVLDLAWKIAPMTDSLKAGFSSPCVVAAAQVALFGIGTLASFGLIWIKRVLCEEIPAQWNAASRKAPNAPAHG